MLNTTTIPSYCSHWGLVLNLFKSYLLDSQVAKTFWVGKDTLLVPLDTNPFKIFNSYPTLCWKEKNRLKELINCFQPLGNKLRVVLLSKVNSAKVDEELYIKKDDLWRHHYKLLSKQINPSTNKLTNYNDLTFKELIWGYPAFWVLDDIGLDYTGIAYKLELYYEWVLSDVLKHVGEKSLDKKGKNL